MSYNLGHHNHEVVESRDGLEGLKIASYHKSDIVIADAMLPRIDMVQFLRIIKHNGIPKSIPFIILKCDMVQVYYFSKPLPAEEIEKLFSWGTNEQ